MTTESLSVTIEGELLTVEIGTVAAPAGGGGGGSGDVVGPASATDDRIAAFDGVTGKLIKQGSVTATAVASHLGSTSNPHSVTAAQVGADATGTAASAVSAHSGAVDPHGDRAYSDGLAGNYATAGHNHSGVYQPLATVLTNTTAAFTTAQETKLSGIATGATANATDADLRARSSHTGTQLASTISDFTSAAAAAAPVQSVAGRTGAVVIAVADVSGAESTANKAQPSGYASLDSGGKVPQAQIPAIAITEYLGDVASQAAMLALSGQKGDWCTRSDTGATWIITGTDPTLLGSWTSVTYPASPVTSVAGRTGAVTLSTSDVSGLTALATTTPGTGIATALAVAVGSAGAPVINGGAGGTPSSLTLTNATGLPPAGIAQSGATSSQVLAWNGSAWAPATPSGGGTPAGSGTELQYRNGSSFGAMSGTAWDDTNRCLALTGATVTTSKPIFDLSQTWNAGAVTFTGWKLNVTDTASATGSILADWQIGGSSRARILKSGEVSVSATEQSTTYAKLVSGSTGAYMQVKLANGNISRIYSDTSGKWMFDDGSSGEGLFIDAGNGIRVSSGAYIGFGDATNTYSATADVRLFRDAANRLALRRTTNAQTLIVSGTYTDASNLVQAELGATSTAVTLSAVTAGTGADNVPVVLTPAGTSQVEVGNGVQFTEMTAPSAPAANKVILFAQDNGAGKTQLMALFPSGAAQQVSIEP